MKIFPDIKEFKHLTRKGNLIPVFGEILADLDTPLSSFMKLGGSAYSFLLESVEGGENVGRYSFLGHNPELVFESKGRKICITKKKKKKTFITREDPLAELKKLFLEYQYVASPKLPRFTGGLVGYMGYDMIRFFENIPDRHEDDQGFPESMFMLTDTMLIFDRVEQCIKIVANAHIKGSKDKAYKDAVKKIEKIKDSLQKGRVRRKTKKIIKMPQKAKSNLSYKEYEKRIKRIKQYIKNGDIFQTVFSQRFEFDIPFDPIDIYRSIRTINPSPYMYFLKFGKKYIIGSSPEILVRCEDGEVTLRPIAGTRRRGIDKGEDLFFEKELQADTKEKAEHIMLVDLGRNDIGRVCRYNSVKIQELMILEKYSHVMHLVSDIKGRLKKDKDQFDLIRATFPAGTVSGAPKIRAMEIIDELETTRRGPYAGSLGYFGFSGNLDQCITIRTIVINGKKGYLQAGGGIVADSKPTLEYKETLNKARAMMKALEMAGKGIY